MDAELDLLLESPPEEERREFVSVNVEEEDISAESDAIKKESTTQADGNTAELVSSIKRNMSMYVSRDSSPVCIYKVPAKLRRSNEKAFTPRLVSIGPIHHGRPELKSMQRYKWRFFCRYLPMMSISLDQLATAARDMEDQVRQCYQESFDNLDSKEFSEMILLDGIFLIMLLLDNPRTSQDDSIWIVKEARPIIEIVPASGLPRTGSASLSVQVSRNQWVKSDILHDSMLLENQLPFFVLEHFCSYIGNWESNLQKRIHNFYSRVGNIGTFVEKEINAMHLVDILRAFCEPRKSNWRGKIVYNRSATELHEAGVKFEGRVTHDDIFEMSFSTGCLKIPTLRIDEHTEILFRNLIAFEQCQDGIKKDITSYIIFMDSLINTAKDVDLLVSCGVINNFYGDHERVASLFNNLHKEIVGHENEFYFTELCTELNKYSKDYWHQWKAKWYKSKKVLRQDYFNTPWSTISVIAAVILLLLTMVQAVCSIVSIL